MEKNQSRYVVDENGRLCYQGINRLHWVIGLGEYGFIHGGTEKEIHYDFIGKNIFFFKY